MRPCQLGLTLNIDTTAGAFLQERSVIEVLGEAAGCPIDNLKKGITEFQRRNMRKAMSGLMVSSLVYHISVNCAHMNLVEFYLAVQA